MNWQAPRTLLAVTLCALLVGCGGKSTTIKGDEELGLDPQDSPAELYVKMAEEYYARGQTEVAFRRAQQAVKADNKYPRAHAWLAFLFEELRQNDEAAKHYERAVALAPNNADILNAYASFLCRQRKYAEADANFLKAASNPVYTTPWIALTNAGNCALDAGNATKADTHYRAAIQKNPAFGPALVKMAELAMKRGDAKGAKDYIDRYFKPETARIPGASRIALQVGAEAERKLGNRKRAAYYEEVLRKSFAETPKTRDL